MSWVRRVWFSSTKSWDLQTKETTRLLLAAQSNSSPPLKGKAWVAGSWDVAPITATATQWTHSSKRYMREDVQRNCISGFWKYWLVIFLLYSGSDGDQSGVRKQGEGFISQTSLVKPALVQPLQSIPSLHIKSLKNPDSHSATRRSRLDGEGLRHNLLFDWTGLKQLI